VRPRSAGEFGLYVDHHWYQLNIQPGLVPRDPIGRLPISLLTVNAIEPLFGITDQRRDKRIDFVGGARGMEGLSSRVDSGEMAGRTVALSDTDDRPDGGGGHGRDHATEVDVVRAEARRRPGQPRPRLKRQKRRWPGFAPAHRKPRD